jgi:hypothetical protein
MSDERLQALQRFGPFFAVTQIDDADDQSASGSKWLPLTAMVEEPALLAGRIAAVRRALASPMPGMVASGVPVQVAVSVTQLGLAARLVAVALAAAVDRVRLPGAAGLVFQDRLGGPYPLGFSTDETESGSEVGWPDRLHDLAWPVTQLIVDGYGLSARVAWGNVASALASAARMIASVDSAAGARAEVLAARAFAAGELRGTGCVDHAGMFRRRSCCLIYRLATDPVFCGDCVLTGRDRAGRTTRSRAASDPNTGPIVPYRDT